MSTEGEQLKNKKVTIVMLSIIVIIFALWSVPKVVFFFEVDHCLDSGGSYNYDQCECDYKMNHSFKENHECN
jgi:hypothetical protein